MDAWTFLWLMLFLKIPIVALFLIVRWAVKQTPETQPGAEGNGGVGPRPSPHRPRPRTRLPRRRGPHGEPMPVAPARMRTVVARARLVSR